VKAKQQLIVRKKRRVWYREKKLREEHKKTKTISLTYCVLERLVSLVFMSRKQAGEEMIVSWDITWRQFGKTVELLHHHNNLTYTHSSFWGLPHNKYTKFALLLMKTLFAVNKGSLTIPLSKCGRHLLTLQYRTEHVIKKKHHCFQDESLFHLLIFFLLGDGEGEHISKTEEDCRFLWNLLSFLQY